MRTIDAVAAALMAVACGAAAGPWLAAQVQPDFIPVGVAYTPSPDPAVRRRELEDVRRSHFNVISLVPRSGTSPPAALTLLDRLLSGAADSGWTAEPGPRTIVVTPSATSPGELTMKAWAAVAQGSRGVIFEDWAVLRNHPALLRAASSFAGELTRNAALYAPLRPRQSQDDVRIDGGGGTVTATFLESSEALVLIVLNHGHEPRRVTLTFTADVPEAIWQNMLSGAAVNFVAGPTGPIYPREFAAEDVLVLMIRKRWREP